MRKQLDSLVFAITNAVIYASNPRLLRFYWRENRRLMNAALPKSYLEYMLWRKVVDRNPRFVMFSDKLATKEYWAKVCPDLAVPGTLWTGRDADDIPDSALAGDVYVKTNHGFNFNYRIRNGSVDRQDLKKTTDVWMKAVHGVGTGEWSYSQIEPKLYVEEAIGDAAADLVEINIRASDGRFIMGSVIGHHKLPGTWVVYLDGAGNATAGPDHRQGDVIPQLPEGLDIAAAFRRASGFAERASKGMDYARYDFMWNGTELYGGEVTIYPSSAMTDFPNREYAADVLSKWDLSSSHFLTSPQTGAKRVYAEALRRRLKG